MFRFSVIDPVIGIFAAALAPLAGYFVAYRRFSGSVSTTEADKLWSEAESIRVAANQRIERLEQRVTEVEAENAKCQRTILKLERKLMMAGIDPDA